jgi:Tfp pilus assembly protein FimT
MLVVLALMGIVTGIGFYTANTGRWRSSAAASDVAQQLEMARSRAMFNRHDVVVSFDTTVNALQIHEDRNSDGNFDGGIGETLVVRSLAQTTSGMEFAVPAGLRGLDGNVVTDPVTLPGSPPAVTFDPLARANTGVIYLIPSEDLAKGDPTNMRAISISAATGRLRRWRYDAESGGPGPWRVER